MDGLGVSEKKKSYSCQEWSALSFSPQPNRYPELIRISSIVPIWEAFKKMNTFTCLTVLSQEYVLHSVKSGPKS